jgi:hypothetical protein
MRNTRRYLTLTATIAAAVVIVGCSRNVVVGSEPSSGGTGSPANVDAQLQTVLSSFAKAQSEYFGAEGRYAQTVSDLGFDVPADVRVDVIQGDRNGFSAIASRADAECGVYGGDARSPRGYLSGPDTPGCRE